MDLIPKFEPVKVRDDNELLSSCKFSLINFPSIGVYRIKEPSSGNGSILRSLNEISRGSLVLRNSRYRIWMGAIIAATRSAINRKGR